MLGPVTRSSSVGHTRINLRRRRRRGMSGRGRRTGEPQGVVPETGVEERVDPRRAEQEEVEGEEEAWWSIPT